jgi:hypothetical protein
MIHITIGFNSEILSRTTTSQGTYTGPFTVEGRSDSVNLANLYRPIWVRTGYVIEISHELAVGVACEVFRMNCSGGQRTRVVWQDRQKRYSMRAQVVCPIEYPGCAKSRGGGSQDEQHAKIDTELPQKVNPLPNALITPTAGDAFSCGIVRTLGTVDAHSHLKSVRLKELAPVLGEQESVSLQRIRDDVVVLPQQVLDRDCLLIERAAADQRFTTMPHELHARVREKRFFG